MTTKVISVDGDSYRLSLPDWNMAPHVQYVKNAFLPLMSADDPYLCRAATPGRIRFLLSRGAKQPHPLVYDTVKEKVLFNGEEKFLVRPALIPLDKNGNDIRLSSRNGMFFEGGTFYNLKGEPIERDQFDPVSISSGAWIGDSYSRRAKYLMRWMYWNGALVSRQPLYLASARELWEAGYR